MTEDWLLLATRSVRNARRDHFLKEDGQTTVRLSEAVEQLRQAIGELEALPKPLSGSEPLRDALAAWRRELRIAESSQRHAEGWRQQWAQTLQSAAGLEAGYNRQGATALHSEPLRISLEG